MSTENINIISVCSIVMGNNIPLASSTRTKQAEQQQAATGTQGKQQAVEEKSSTKVQAAKSGTECAYRGLLRRVLIVGILALVLGRWCRKRRGEPEEQREA